MIGGFAHPAAFAALGLAAPIIALWMLRTRRPRQVVPSTFLWREALTNVTASRPWQPLRLSILLILQLAALTLLVVALASPFRRTTGITGDHLVLILDASGSMQATDAKPTRLDAAKREAESLISSMRGGALVSVVEASSRPRVVLSSSPDRSLARKAVRTIESEDGKADFAEAFLLAESLETPNRPASIALVSDGGLTTEERGLVPPGTIFRPVGGAAPNVGIAGVDVGEEASGFRAFVRLRSSFTSAKSLEVVLERDGTPVVASPVRIPAGGTIEKAFDLGLQPGRLTVRISQKDALQGDNEAFAVLARARPRRILLMTPGNLFLETLLGKVPGAQLTVSPDSADGSGFDLAVYDRVAVPASVKAPALYVAPAGTTPGVRVIGEKPTPPITFVAPGEPLVENVDLSEVAIASAQAVQIPSAKTLIGSEDVPLVAVWSEGTLRRAYFAFDLHASNLPLQIAFPILADHLLTWLTGSDALSSRFAGDSIEIPDIPARQVKMVTPGGRSMRLDPETPFAETGRSGFYRVEYYGDKGLISETTYALSFPPSESDLRPKEVVVSKGGGRPGLSSSATTSLLGLVAMLALLVLTFEWWWAHGRPLPRFVA